MLNYRNNIYILLFITILASSCNNTTSIIKNKDLVIEIDNYLKTKINTTEETLNKSFEYSEFLSGRNRDFKDFKEISFNSVKKEDTIGEYTLYTIKGIFDKDNYKLQKNVYIKTYKNIPNTAIYNVTYKNLGDKVIQPKKWINNYSKIQVLPKDSIVWSFQGESTSSRSDWILPVKQGFYQKNYMGMNNSDYGGGIPVTDLWNRDIGIAKGHLELVPKLISIPVKRKLYDDKVESWVEYQYNDNFNLKKGDSIKTFETFVMIHRGDCFTSLRQFSEIMQLKGIKFVKPEPSAFESIWCAWGYERDFNIKEVLNTLPKVKELGIKWAVLDDGFQKAEGDWDVNKQKFPNGDRDMINFVNKIHSYGLKAKLWWAPLAADPGSDLLKRNKDILLLNDEEAPQYITWWDAYYLAPTSEKTIKHTKEVIDLFMNKWGFDGLKLDGQHMNAVPPDYGENHNIDEPIEAVEKLPKFYKMLYDEAVSIKPNAVVENCPCGTCMSFYNMQYTNQYVSSDPESSWQIRLKGKVYKAIAPQMAYYGDHVELSDGADDFATSFGIGAVLGTKFTWPKDNPTQSESFLLTSEKEKIWKKWFSLYNKMMLSKEEYIGDLYDIGFDVPETHVIKKNDTLYYAFYNDNWSGNIELRGLDKDKRYIVKDYFNNKKLANIDGDNPMLTVDFKGYLLVEVYSE